MQIKPFKALFANPQLLDSPGAFCDDAKNSFKKYLESGFYERCEHEGLYICQIEEGRHIHIGLIGLNHVDDFQNGRVKKHENTLHEREEKQKELFLRWKAILKPVLVAHTPVPELQVWLNAYVHTHKPLGIFRFKKDHAVHRFWAVSDPEDIEYLRGIYASRVKETYIADGHHRSSTTALMYQNPAYKSYGLDFSHIFSAWFAADQLDILDFNRVLEGVKKIGKVRLMALLSKYCDIEPLDKARRPEKKHEMILFLDKGWYALNWREAILRQSIKGFDTLDVELFNDWIVKQVFQVQDVRSDNRINYVDGSQGLAGVEKLTSQKNGDRAGFIFYPVTFDEMARLADAGESLPPKSTYFEPRLKSGLLVRLLEE